MGKYRKETKCIKCGHPFTMDTWEDVLLPTLKIHYDIINRKCTNCGFTWEERPLDYKEPNGEQNETNCKR